MDEDIPATLQSTVPDADEAYYHIDQARGYLSIIKTHIQNPLQWKQSKKSTQSYNLEHKKK